VCLLTMAEAQIAVLENLESSQKNVLYGKGILIN
jgi:hypothetical protein